MQHYTIILVHTINDHDDNKTTLHYNTTILHNLTMNSAGRDKVDPKTHCTSEIQEDNTPSPLPQQIKPGIQFSYVED